MLLTRLALSNARPLDIHSLLLSGALKLDCAFALWRKPRKTVLTHQALPILTSPAHWENMRKWAGFSLISRVDGQKFSAMQTDWRRVQSCANPSLANFPC